MGRIDVKGYIGPLVLTLETTYDKSLADHLRDSQPKPDIVVLPECWYPGEGKNQNEKDEYLGNLSRKYGCYIVGGTYQSKGEWPDKNAGCMSE